jgi:hypothetical protein
MFFQTVTYERNQKYWLADLVTRKETFSCYFYWSDLALLNKCSFQIVRDCIGSIALPILYINICLLVEQSRLA